jgi:hypothetical protein
MTSLPFRRNNKGLRQRRMLRLLFITISNTVFQEKQADRGFQEVLLDPLLNTITHEATK